MADKPSRITAAKEATAEIEEKKSVFIGSIKPVNSESEAVEFIESVKKKHHDARHNVYVYTLNGGRCIRYSDDGEPKGTGGVPIMNVLKMSGVDDVCVVVTRYFGGILLGTGGLSRAYGEAAKAALDAAGIAVMEQYAIMKLKLSYSDYQKVASKLSSVNAKEEKADFGAEVELYVSVKAGGEEAVELLAVQLTNGKSRAETVGYEERC